MAVLSRVRVVAIALAAVLALSASPTHAHDDTLQKLQNAQKQAIQKIQRAVEDVFSGKLFKRAYRLAKEAERKRALRAAGYETAPPFYVPDSKPPRKPVVRHPVKLAPVRRAARTVRPPKPKPPAATAEVRTTQKALNALGFDAGEADGLAGRKTALAIERYQNLIGRPVTGKLTRKERKMLLAAARKKRQMASLQSSGSKGSKAHTVIAKTMPAISPPTYSTPKVEIPVVRAPKDDIPIVRAPKVVNPKIRMPEVTLPKVDVQVAKRPLEALPKRQVEARPSTPAAPPDGAKTTLPQESESNSFDADDPDEDLPLSQ